MPIEFRCSQCGRLLRVGDDSTGRQARCPECGGLTTVPASGGAAPGSPLSTTEPARPSSAGGPPPVRPPDAENPYQSPMQPTMSPAPSQLDLGDVFTRTWEIFKRQWGMCLAAVVIVWILSFGVSFTLGAGTNILGGMTRDQELVLLLTLFDNLVSTLFSVWLGIGEAVFFLKTARGEPASLSDLFTGAPLFVSMVLSGLLFVVCVVAGLVLCIVPGIILALMFSQYYFLIVDRKVGIFDAFSISRDLMQGNKLTLLLIWILTLVGSIVVVVFTCLLGILVVAPFTTLLAPVIYLALTGQPTADRLYFAPPD